MGGDEGLLVGGDVLFEGDGLVFGGGLEAAEGGLDLVDGDVEALGDQGEIGGVVLDLLAEEVAGDRGVVVYEEAAFAVEEAASGGEDGNLAGAVGFGEDAVAVGTYDLEAPEADYQDGQDERDIVLGEVKLDWI